MSYTIEHYPVHLIDVVRLRGGERVTVRPILPQDAAVTQAFVRELSATSRHSRFMRMLRELPSGLLARFTQVDYRNHLALIAEMFVDGREVVVGEARYAIADDGESAEVAVAIADAWQGRGLGSLLIRRIACSAIAAGVTRLTGDVLASNHAMLQLARRAGFEVTLNPDHPELMRILKCLSVQEKGGPCAEMGFAA